MSLPPREDPDNTLRISLKRLGLSAHESSIYAALVAHSPAQASWLAKRCELPRSSVYTALDALMDKGLIGVAYEGEVKQFVPLGHSALVEMLEQERARAEARVALAETLSAHFERPREARIPDVMTFEGQEGLKQVYLSMMQQLPRQATLRLLRDEFLFTQEWHFVFEAPWRRRLSSLKEGKEIETRLLTNRSAEEESHLDYYRGRPGLTHRFLPASLRLSRLALYMGGDMIAVMSMEHGQLVGVRIDNRHLAENISALFDAIWAMGSSSV